MEKGSNVTTVKGMTIGQVIVIDQQMLRLQVEEIYIKTSRIHLFPLISLIKVHTQLNVTDQQKVNIPVELLDSFRMTIMSICLVSVQNINSF